VRYVALLNKKKERPSVNIYNIRRIGFKGFLFSLFGAWAEQKLGSHVGVMPGSDMLKAAKIAKEHRIAVALIDRDIEITLKRFSASLTWKEKWNFLVDLFNAFVLRKKEVDIDLTKVPKKKVIKKLMSIVKKRYPSIYNVLVTERNDVMAKKLMSLMKSNPDKKIIAIVGAGHEEGILKIIKDGINNTDFSYSYSIDA
jgi:pheromone shutdown protein TraB